MITEQVKREVNLLLLIEELQFLCDLDAEDFNTFCPPWYRWEEHSILPLPEKHLDFFTGSAIQRVSDKYLTLDILDYRSPNRIHVVLPDEKMFPVFCSICHQQQLTLESGIT